MAKKIQWGAAKDKWGKYTEDCAADTNRWLQEQGIESYGHAYQVPDQFREVFNGYPSQLPEFPKDATASDSTRIMDYHRLASDNIKENFDKSKLNPNRSYVVNMYYNKSPHMNNFYNEAVDQNTDNYATHVGRLYYNPDKKDWIVEHNIHGNIYQDSFDSVLGGRSNPNPYGITTIYSTKPTFRTFIRNTKNKIFDLLGINENN